MTTPSSLLEQKILDHSARIAIIGLGYVGLPEAVMFAQAGFPVTGFDLDPVRVDKVNAGESYIADVPSEILASLVTSGRLRAALMPPPGSQPPKAMANDEWRMTNGEVEPPNPPKAETAELSSSEQPTPPRTAWRSGDSRTVEPPNDLDQCTQQLNEFTARALGIRYSKFDIRNSKFDSLPPDSTDSRVAECQPPAISSSLPAANCQLPASPSPAASSCSSPSPLDSASCQPPAASFASQDCLCICVPTPLRKTRDPDISYIVGAVQGFQMQLRPGQLVILESTTYPGTTEEVVQPMLEAGGHKAGSDFHLAFSPERVNPGDPLHPPASIPKVVGGVTPACTRLASLLYEQVVTKVLPVSSPRAAEMVKLLENTFRSVNIGLVNELALMCDRFNLDVWEIIDAAASKPFGFMPFYPGPGLGGHCIPVDPFYLSWKARSNGFEARFIELAGQINGYMPKHVVQRVMDALNDREQSVKGSRILILGVAYKPDVSDIRESPALEIIHLLRERGARVSYHDPHVPELIVDGVNLKTCNLQPATVSAQDCVVIVTHHSRVDYKFVVKEAALIVDTRNATRDVPFGREKIIRL